MPRHTLATIEPSGKRRTGGRMFARRVTLIAVVMGVVGAVLSGQTSRMTVLEHERALEEARDRLYRMEWAPTVRGRILDRHGRVLARDRASYALAVDYKVLSGEWARQQARTAARAMHRDAWGILSPSEREQLINASLPTFEAHVDRMWSRLAGVTGVGVDTLRERAGQTIDRVDRLRGSIETRRRREAMIDAVGRGRQQTPELINEVEQRAQLSLQEERMPHILVQDVPDDVAFELLRLMTARVTLIRRDGEPVEVQALPGLEVQRAADRIYPFDTMQVSIDRSTFPAPLRQEGEQTLELKGVAAHALGWVRSGAHREDIERRNAYLSEPPDDQTRGDEAIINTLGDRKVDRGRYRAGDTVGRGGSEYAHEQTLRGLRGLSIERLDTLERRVVGPAQGKDVTLTLDIMLQGRVSAVMDPRLGLATVQPWHNNTGVPDGTPLFGAAVVMEVDSGDVLAMVSTPGLDRDALNKDPQAVLDDPMKPLFNRATGSAYAPGSIAKALVLCGAVTHGHHRLGQGISCQGHLIPDRNDIYRCWIYRDRFGFATHDQVMGHEPDEIEALTVSCNIFFYTLGRRMGPAKLEETYRAFGLGERFDFGVGFENAGAVGAEGMMLGMSDAILMGIGQGPVNWTPLHAASAFATLARLGVHISPRIVIDGSAPKVRETGMDRRAITHALEGLRGVINDPTHGTAYAVRFPSGRDVIFNTPDVEVIGKTGTATVQIRELDGSTGMRDHAWMVVLVGPEGQRPAYSICVLLEQGGSGGRAAGAVVNQIVHALRAEGYL